MTAATTQFNVRIAEDAAAAARQAAASRHMSVQAYIESLVRSDTDPIRARFLSAAQNTISEFGDLIEESARAARD
jgi:hypothetical protein